MRFAVLWLFLGTIVFAQSPASLAGVTYRETINNVDVTGRATLDLAADGTYTTSYQRLNTSKSMGFIAEAEFEPETGAYKYQILNEGQAVLTLHPGGTTTRLLVDFATSPSVVVRNLTFLTSTSGTMAGNGSQGTFTLTPAGASNPFRNASVRGFGNRTRPVILGFYVAEHEAEVLIRGIGPGLKQFGILNPATNPSIELYRGQEWVWRNMDWDATTLTAAAVRSVGAKVGAFPLVEKSGDAAMVIRLQPGVYTFHVYPTEDAFVEVLAEAYVLP
jgi:hypothetical protein